MQCTDGCAHFNGGSCGIALQPTDECDGFSYLIPGHSPTPWLAVSCGPKYEIRCGKPGDQFLVATLPADWEGDAVNADLIVRAVNHHEELVLLAQRYLALRHCAVTDDYNRMTRKELKRSYDGLEEWCREVLAKIDGEAQ